MKTPTEAAEAAYAHAKKLIADAPEGSKRKSGWFPDFEIEKAFLAGHAHALEREAVKGLVEALRWSLQNMNPPFEWQPFVKANEALAAFEKAKAGGAL